MNMSAHATTKRDTVKPYFLCFRVQYNVRLHIAEIMTWLEKQLLIMIIGATQIYIICKRDVVFLEITIQTFLGFFAWVIY